MLWRLSFITRLLAYNCTLRMTNCLVSILYLNWQYHRRRKKFIVWWFIINFPQKALIYHTDISQYIRIINNIWLLNIWIVTFKSSKILTYHYGWTILCNFLQSSLHILHKFFYFIYNLFSSLIWCIFGK